jgi:cytosine/uracil/thiamine/allantoin permease
VLASLLYSGTNSVIAPLEAHRLISLTLVVKTVSSTAQWNTFRAADIVAESFPEAISTGKGGRKESDP